MKIFTAVYLLLINLSAFILYFADKQKAKRQRWRVPEATLLGIALAGGSLGAFLAMRIFRHKTRHPKFYISVPVMLCLHTIILIFLLKHFC